MTEHITTHDNSIAALLIKRFKAMGEGECGAVSVGMVDLPIENHPDFPSPHNDQYMRRSIHEKINTRARIIPAIKAGISSFLAPQHHLSFTKKQ